MKSLHYTRLLLEPGSRGAVTLRDPYDLHATLWRAFEGRASERPFLFRADLVRSEAGLRWKVLVQATTAGRWESLGASLVELQQAEHTHALAVGARFRFLLRANCTRRKKGQNEFGDLDREAFRAARGKRVAVFGEEAQRAWLAEKIAAAGCSLVHEPRLSNARAWYWNDRGRHARHDGVDFEGVLRVDDVTRAASALEEGIGPARAFGFGLLSLARLPA